MNEKLKKIILLFLRNTIAQPLQINFNDFTKEYLDEFNNNPFLLKKIGNFVTLNIDKNLRGCVGQIFPYDSLKSTLAQNALSSAFRDSRFEPLSKEEFYNVEIEVSLLTKPEEIIYKDKDELLEKIIQDKDGIIIQKGIHSATFLPQVWESLSTKEDFLSHLCIKAGLEPKEWAKASLKVDKYQVDNFDEKILRIKK